MTIELFADTDGDGLPDGTVVATTTTDVNGDYSFADVIPGDYVVVEAQPTGFDTVTDVDSTFTDDDISKGSLIDDLIPVSVSAGETDDGNDFVEFDDKADTFAEFQTEFAAELGAENAAADNPDGDIYSNALEYALWLNPGSGAGGGGEFCLEKDPVTGEVSAHFMRRRGGLSDVTYTLEGANGLGTPTTWFPITSVTETIDTTSPDVPFDSEMVTFENLQTAAEFTNGTEVGVVRLAIELNGETFVTKAFGWQCVGYLDFQCASFSAPFSEKPAFSGSFGGGTLTTATDANGNVTLDLSDSALGEDLSSLVGSNGEYYLLVTSGALEGERFDILSGGLESITLVNDPNIFSESDGVESLSTLSGVPADADFNGASYQLIRYQTVDDLFDPEGAYAGLEATDPANATRLLFFNSRLDDPGFEILFLNGTSTADSRWVLSDDLVALTDQGDYRLDPVGGNWIHLKNSGVDPLIQVSAGIIACSDQAVALNEGFNLVGAIWPLDQTAAGPEGRDYSPAAGFVGGVDPSQSTNILLWTGDASVDVSG